MSEENSSSSDDISSEDLELVSNDRISLFIIKAQANALKSAEAFLKNRNWIVSSTTGMREALAYIIQNKPEFVMIPADHSSKKIKALPKLLQQAFPVKIIAYSDSTAPAAMMALRDMAQPYTLFPPASGPQIERIVLKIKKDLELAAKNEADAKENAANDNNIKELAQTIKGGSDKSNTKATFNSEQAKAALNQLIHLQNNPADDSTDLDLNQNAGPSGSIAYMPTHGDSSTNSNQGQAPGTAYMPGETNASQQSGGYIPGQGSSQQSGGYIPNHEGQKGLGHFSHFDPSHPDNQQKENESFAEWEERMRRSLMLGGNGEEQTPNINEENPSTKPKHSSGDTSPSGISSDDEYYTRAGQRHAPNDESTRNQNGAQIPIIESPYIKSKRKKPGLYIQGEQIDDDSNQSIIIRGTRDALEKSVITSTPPGKIPEDLEKSTNVACITVESERFSGYLIAAMGKDRKIDKSLINTIKERLFAFLKANGEAVKDDETMGIKIQEVEFEDWAIEQAQFLRKSIHHGDEIAMAFFPHKDVQIKLEDSASEKMAKMNIDEIKGDVALEFDLYIYMPENNKYLLYTPQGMTFYGEQKNRLKEKGVDHMHLKKDSISNVKKYRAQNYLNEKIEVYKMAKKLKVGGG